MPLLQLIDLLSRVCGWSVPECSKQVFSLSGKLQSLQHHSVPRLPSWFLPQLQLVPQVQRELLRLLFPNGLLELRCGVLPEFKHGLQQLSVVLGKGMPDLQHKWVSVLRSGKVP
jgi:hypothetical protein